MKSLRKSILALVALALLACAAWAQGGTGTVQGTVKVNKAPLAGAKVILGSAADSQFRQVLATDAQGSFTATGVPLGVVSVKVFDAAGKFVIKGEGIVERAGETITLVLDSEP